MNNQGVTRAADARADIYTSVTDQIVATIEAGAASYTFPWHHVPGLPKNLASDRAYRGINTVLLWLIGNARGYATPYWATFRQWLELGHPVRKGEKSATVVFWKQLDGGDSLADAQADGDDAPGRRPFVARAYHVFNAAQVDGFSLPHITPLSESERDARAEAFFGKLPIEVRHEGGQAYYQPATDSVHLPEFGLFRDANAYYATRGHESVHATGAKHRLDRDLSGRFSSHLQLNHKWLKSPNFISGQPLRKLEV